MGKQKARPVVVLKQEYDRVSRSNSFLKQENDRLVAENQAYRHRDATQQDVLVAGADGMLQEVQTLIPELEGLAKTLSRAKAMATKVSSLRTRAGDTDRRKNADIIRAIKAAHANQDLVSSMAEEIEGLRNLVGRTQELQERVDRYENFGILGRMTAMKLMENLPSNFKDIPIRQFTKFPSAVWVLFRIFFTWFLDEVDRRGYKLPEGKSGRAPLIFKDGRFQDMPPVDPALKRAKLVAKAMRIAERHTSGQGGTKPAAKKAPVDSDLSPEAVLRQMWEDATKDASPMKMKVYDRHRTYKVDDLVAHKSHGLGQVREAGDGEMVVLFREGFVRLEIDQPREED